MLERRLQVLLDENRYARVRARARETNQSVGAVIREAIDRALPTTGAGRAKAARDILAAPPMSVPDAAELRAELEELRGRRG